MGVSESRYRHLKFFKIQEESTECRKGSGGEEREIGGGDGEGWRRRVGGGRGREWGGVKEEESGRGRRKRGVRGRRVEWEEGIWRRWR